MRLSIYVFMAALAAVWLSTTRLRADDVAVAPDAKQYEETVQRALHEFALEHWIEAKVLFAQAYALRPNARVLRGLGLACYELRQYVQAIEHFEAALLNGVQPLTPEMTSDVHTFLARAREFVGRVRLEIQPLYAELSIDGEKAPRIGADGSYALDPGSHEVSVSAPGYEPQSRSLFAEGGKTTQLSLSLKPEAQPVVLSAPAPLPVATPPLIQTDTDEPNHVAPWVVVGVSGAVAVAGGVMLAVAAVNKNQVEDPGGNAMWSDYEDAYDTGQVLFPIGSVMLGVGLAGVAVGLSWRFLFTPEKSAQPSAALDLTPTGVRISGSL